MDREMEGIDGGTGTRRRFGRGEGSFFFTSNTKKV